MSLLAKILVVLQTVLALVFLGVQATLYYHAQDWRRAFESMRDRHVQVTKERQLAYDSVRVAKEDVEKKRDELARDNEQMREQVKIFDAEVRKEQSNYSGKKQEFDKLQDTHDSVVKTLKDKDARISDLEKDNDRLQAENRKNLEDKEAAEQQVARLLHMRTALEKDLTQTRKDYADAKQKAIDLQLVLDELERIGVPVSSIVLNYKPVPPIRGKVAGVKTDIQPALVVINVGVDDKVEKGYQFTVYRGSTFIGKVVVERIAADGCGARVLFTAPGQTIQAGDDAATRLD
jgi:hypothetical protein